MTNELLKEIRRAQERVRKANVPIKIRTKDFEGMDEDIAIGLLKKATRENLKSGEFQRSVIDESILSINKDKELHRRKLSRFKGNQGLYFSENLHETSYNYDGKTKDEINRAYQNYVYRASKAYKLASSEQYKNNWINLIKDNFTNSQYLSIKKAYSSISGEELYEAIFEFSQLRISENYPYNEEERDNQYNNLMEIVKLL